MSSAYVVSDDKPARTTLFTWTTREHRRLAMPSELYVPTTQRLRDLAKTLGKAGDAGPFTHAPAVAFPAEQIKVQ